MKTKRILVLNDVHIPYHDPHALDLVFDVAEDIEITDIIINGDLIDAYNVNLHGPKHPEIVASLLDEFEAVDLVLNEIRERFPNARKLWIFGNHMNRLERFIIKNSKPFWNIITPKNQLNLKDFETVEYNDAYNIKGTDLNIQHSPPSYGENGARTSLIKKFGGSWIFGCTHRIQQAHIRRPDGSISSAYFNGWLGSTTLTDQHKLVFSYTKGHENWQQGFSIVDVIGSEYFVHQCLIKNHQTSLDGHFYDGRKAA